MNVKRFIQVAVVIYVAALIVMWAAVVSGSGGGPETDAQNDTNETETPGGHVANSSAYANASCVPGLVGDGTGCLDGDTP